MRPTWFGLLAMLASGCLAVGASPIVFGEKDGSLRFQPAQAPEMILRLGLPAVPATRIWREGQALCGTWVTNGIRYTQTVLVRPAEGAKTDGTHSFPPVLLVDLHGENLNSEYAEARADLTLQAGGERQSLELKEGLVWMTGGERRTLLGALEMPGSGVKTTEGQALQFAGNMPPSEKGSMTLKIPLRPLQGPPARERLADLDFAQELRRMTKAGEGVSRDADWELVLGGKLEVERADEEATQSRSGIRKNK